MTGWSWGVVVFLGAAFTERVVHSIAKRETVRGEQRMRWSLYALYTLYVLILLGSLAEHVVLRPGLILWVAGLGLGLYAASLVLRLVAVKTLGRFWSLQVEVRDEHQLVNDGIYHFMRHPIYASIILEVVSIPLVANAWWTLALLSPTHILVILLRVRREELELIGRLGDTYRKYQQEVGALLPRWTAWRSVPRVPRDSS